MMDKATILAIDDTSESLALLVKTLTSRGYHVLPADSGPLALAAAQTRVPDLILLDLRMEGMDGLEVCRQLKADDRTRHIPVILLSAYAEVNEWVEGLNRGAADYITKPFHEEELFTRVRTQIALKRSTDSLLLQAEEIARTNKQLQEEVETRRNAEEGLKTALEENRLLLSELQHRVKNSFAMILSMINLSTPDDPDSHLTSILDDLQARIRSVSELYAFLYSTGSFTELRLDEYCYRIIKPLVEMTGIDLKTDMEEIVISVKEAAPVGLILTELVTNAVKYAFPGSASGTISFMVRLGSKTVHLEVSDDGVGIPEEFDIALASGLGLRLVQTLTEQIHGTFVMHRISPGTRCVVEFPVPESGL